MQPHADRRLRVSLIAPRRDVDCITRGHERVLNRTLEFGSQAEA